MKSRKMLLFLIFVLMAITAKANFVFSATFTVEDIDQFQPALNSASNNGADDTIEVSTGVYSLAAGLSYVSTENQSLTIRGAGMDTTILDGGGTFQVLTLMTSQDNASIRLENLTIRNGQTAGNGGALLVATNAADITVVSCRIMNSTATGGESVGGGANLNSESGTVTVQSSFVSGNTSRGNVGGLFVGTTSGEGALVNSTFSGNSVTNTGSSDAFGDAGGAMFYSQATSSATISGNTFSGNMASGGDNPDGGGLMTYQLGGDSELNLDSNSFSDNTAGLGGGGVIVRCNVSCRASVTRNSFLRNTATIGSGGGAHLYINDGTLAYSTNVHTGNRAGEDGAGAWIDMIAGTATLSDNVFTENNADNNGGGLSAVADDASITVKKSIFDSNTSGNVGAGLSFATVNGTGIIQSNTLYGNIASGEAGGIYVYIDAGTGQATLTSNILWNDAPDEFAYSSGGGGVSVVLQYSDIMNGTGEAWFGTGCIAADPLFVDAAGGNFNLTWAHEPTNDATKSPCIDTGDPTLPVDADGTRADMGALAFVQQKAGVIPAIALLLLL
ncbi:hypothetical protein [Desulfovibrio inopinatus]|uniref:hypothetical protein n=1 Tax=Desulfovibrio inopinatus TaxID=102109 RepID=UPI0012EC1AE1|nr:hypothetical protein [Desulfovibrio inopinatus]